MMPRRIVSRLAANLSAGWWEAAGTPQVSGSALHPLASALPELLWLHGTSATLAAARHRNHAPGTTAAADGAEGRSTQTAGQRTRTKTKMELTRKLLIAHHRRRPLQLLHQLI